MIITSRLKTFAIELIDGVVSVSVVLGQLVLLLYLVFTLSGGPFVSYGHSWEIFQFFVTVFSALALNGLALSFAKISLCLAPAGTSKT